MPPLYANLTSNISVPSVSGGILWADNVNKRIYLFGGEYTDDQPREEGKSYNYDALNKVWTASDRPRPGIQGVSYGAGISVSDRGEGYYYGGWLSNGSVAGWSGPAGMTNGLVKYTYDTDAWTNITGPDDVGRAEGVMMYIPASDGGMLIYFGGIKDEFRNGTARWQDMQEIFVYDVLSSKWYSQNATGDIPGQRRRFCGGVMWAADQSSYNIYIYGGASPPPSTSGYDDVYILTIPTFTWIKAYPNTTNETGEFPHHSLSCNVVSQGQMLIIGGSFPLSSTCDVPAQFGTHNLDLGQQNPEKAWWQLFRPNLTTYAVPDAVVGVVGGGPAGGATNIRPNNGFQAPDLNILMTRKASVAVRTPTRAIPSATGTGTSKRGQALSTGAIAGIAVGGAIVFLMTLVGCCWFIRNSRRRHLADKAKTAPGTPYMQEPPEGETWTPLSSPFSHTSIVPSRQRQQAYELPAENGIPAELQSPDGSYLTTTTTQDGTVYKVDEQGRVWVTKASPTAPSAGLHSASLHGSGGGYGYSPVASSSPPPSTQPLELSTGPRSPVDEHALAQAQGAWGAGSPHGSQGRVHETYYHP